MTTAPYGDDVTPVVDVRGLRHGASARVATALAFTSIRPIVGFGGTALLISYAGLSAWQALVALLIALLLVAVVFGALASRWPVEGGVHGWARQLTGARGGFVTGWLYLCSYVLFMTSLAYFDVQRIFYLFGLEPPTVLVANICTAAVLLLATVANTVTRAWVKVIALIAVAASLIGCIGYSIALIVGHSSRGFGDIMSSGGADAGGAWLSGSFLVALAWASAFAFRGFEIPSDISEEMDDAPRVVPRAMLTGLIVGGVLTILAGISIALVVPAAPKVSAELVINPYAASVGTTVEVAMGAGAAKLLALLLVIATFAAIAVCQLAASRTIWTMARDRELPRSAWLVQLSPRRRLPRNAIIVVAVIEVIFPFLISEVKTAYVLQGASVAPLMIAFLIPLVGLLRSSTRSSWKSGPFALGRWRTPIALVAALALLGLAVNSLWPREELYGRGRGLWGPVAIAVAIVILGLVVMAWAYRSNGIHVRNHGHLDRDLDQRVRIGHAGTCAVCHQNMVAGDEAFWNPEAYELICFFCDDVAADR